MYKTQNSLPEEQRAKLVELLNRRLADSIDLMLQAKEVLSDNLRITGGGNEKCWSSIMPTL